MDTQSLFYFFLLLFCFLTFMLKNVFVYAIIWMDLSFIKIDFSDSPVLPNHSLFSVVAPALDSQYICGPTDSHISSSRTHGACPQM